MRLEQCKGHIQCIDQQHSCIQLYNMRYKGSVEDRVHQMFSSSLQSIYHLFGQPPDILEDAWVKVALGDQADAKNVIDAIPQSHPFELRYTCVEPIDWESCKEVLDAQEKRRILAPVW